MMKTKKYSFDEMIDGLQSMSVSELKQVEKNSEVVFQNDGEYPDSDSFKDEYNELMENLTDTIYNLSLSEIKNIQTTPVIIENQQFSE